MRRSTTRLAMLLALAVAGPAAAQTAIEIEKELFPKWKKAQAEAKGLQEEALEYFTQAKEAWPAE